VIQYPIEKTHFDQPWKLESKLPLDRGTMDEQGGSITQWLGDLKGGDLAAAQPLWERYFKSLVVLARKKLERRQRTRAEADEEDAALSAFNSFCVGVAAGRFPQLADREDLWRILVTITARKAFAQTQRQKRLKRGGGTVVAEAVLRGPRGDSADSGAGPGLDLIAGNEPTPEFAAMVAEEYERLLEVLNDERLRMVAISRMEGYTCDEIASQLGCARRTVARRLDLIRKTWMADGEVA
jgi:DNA-directed RNA polymerase specialized sigma24 family protein